MPKIHAQEEGAASRLEMMSLRLLLATCQLSFLDRESVFAQTMGKKLYF
jgi:hypothetical protein